ncbi:MAG TPA: cytochrome c [Holophagaceae bacterium]|nr:cytochrome c [Holophagaceae bacterium]
MRVPILACLAALPALAQAPAAAPAKVDVRAFFQMNCVACHGVDGSATGPDGRRLKGQDFTDKKDMAGMTDAKLVKTIQKGLFFGRRMPSFKDRISEADSLRLVQEVLRKAEKGKVIAPEGK